MGANRSRTERWRECFEQVRLRDGSIEISVDSGINEDGKPNAASLIWRVRLVHLGESEMHVEQPIAMGQAITLSPGTPLIGGLTIGQNRWMFRSRVAGAVQRPGSSGRPVTLLKLELPNEVERCSRRNFYRMSTAEISLPRVECWPLLDPTTVGPAEVANRTQLLSQQTSASGDEPFVLPEVGPKFLSRLVNLGGGGAGLVIDRADAGAIERSRFFWMRVDLSPVLTGPVGITARLAHMHLDSLQNVYAGMAFEFMFHQAHRQFVVDQICRYVSMIQDSSLRKSA